MKTEFLQNFALLSLILIMRYLLGAGLFYYFFRNRTPQKVLIDDLKWSILSSLVFALAGASVILMWESGWTQIYLDVNAFPLWYSPVSLIIYLFLHDAFFYWSHRLLHLIGFKNIHVVHHLSRRPTAFTSFSFHPIEALLQAAFLPVLILLIPVNIFVLGLFLLLMSVFGITNHLGTEIYPEWLEKKLFLITANHHQKHHEDFDKNFGLYFTFWDRLMKTEKGSA